MARSRSSRFKSFAMLTLPWVMGAGAVHMYQEHQNAQRQEFRAALDKAVGDAGICVENVKGAQAGEVTATRDYIRDYDSLVTHFNISRRDEAGGRYDLTARVKTNIQDTSDYAARTSRKEYREDQKQVYTGALRGALEGLPPNKGGSCFKAADADVPSCLKAHGWEDGYARLYSPHIKTGQHTRADSIRITFEETGANGIGTIEITKQRPPQMLEMNGGAPINPLAEEAADAIAACHAQALEKHFGPANE